MAAVEILIPTGEGRGYRHPRATFYSGGRVLHLRWTLLCNTNVVSACRTQPQSHTSAEVPLQNIPQTHTGDFLASDPDLWKAPALFY